MNYKVNNPVFRILKTKEEDLVKEFENSLKSGIYSIIIIFADRLKYQNGTIEIVACWCWGDVLNFFPTDGENTNFELVPDNSKVNAYLRYKALQPLI